MWSGPPTPPFLFFSPNVFMELNLVNALMRGAGDRVTVGVQ